LSKRSESAAVWRFYLNDEINWVNVGPVEYRGDEGCRHDRSLEAKGNMYRIVNQTRDAFHQGGGESEWVECRHHAPAMLRYIGDRNPAWTKAIRRRENRRKKKAGKT
jgi:hypothetical protein